MTEASEYIDSVYQGLEVDPATLYAIKVVKREIVAGPWVRLSCKRHLNDLERDDLIWDIAAAQHAIDFFPEILRFTDGDKVDLPFELSLWQQFIVGCLFGWKTLDGWRRFRTAYVEIGKGNGKSPLAGGIGLYLLAADREGAAEVYAAATKLDQAKILWNDAKRMAESSPHLSGIVDVKTNLLSVLSTNSIFKPISSEKRGLDGPRVHGGLIDELHEHADATVVNKLRAGTKARKQALIFEITNSGFNKQTVCYQHHEQSVRILQGIARNDTWFSYIAALDAGDDWENNEKVWIKANPNLDISIPSKYIRGQVDEARDMPANRAIIARLNFCIWTGAEAPWISEEKWTACQRTWEELEDYVAGYPCWGGLDLSQRKDLTALSLTWDTPRGKISRVWYFTPKVGIEQRSKADQAHYDLWAEQGWLIATPGSIVDYKFVVHAVKILHERYEIQGIAFDPWKINEFKKIMDDEGLEIPMVKHGQGFQGGLSKDSMWMPRSIEAWEEAILTGNYYVEENPCTLSCAANATITPDPQGNRKWDKTKSTGRMDGTVAQAMSVGLATDGFPEPEESETSKYETQGFLVLGR